ncbi:hypothetical protein [Paenibacillus lutimineralis]|uniref:Intracellular proteinase inhibitor BsuPI domain-containing protein n=1 Tax=Paenibacillus lutimineralis TaxID=2707005 RepID=A0A3Q9ICD2_9BACL|nr:hypothetical protein [Paenibacillus lutimineralis]AZS16017.1 hypothetical protein EI981_17315 [Paenibacillus lutimineralis]
MRKNTLRLLLILIVAGVVLSGCGSGETLPASSGNSEDLTASLYVQQSNPDKDESIFSVEMIIPSDIQVNEPFEIEGLLCNNSDKKVEILHGAAMFTYVVYNSDGVEVPNERGTYTISDIGIGVLLEPNSKYSYDGGGHVSTKLNEIVLERPGIYTIVAQAEFHITGSGENSRVSIKSDPYEIELK